MGMDPTALGVRAGGGGGGEATVILCAEDGRSVRRVLRVQEGATAEFEFVLP